MADAQTETPVVDRENDPTLALWFTPQSIKDHFNNSDAIEALTDEQLVEIGTTALNDNLLYAAFHEALTAAAIAMTGSDPDEDDEDEEDG